MKYGFFDDDAREYVITTPQTPWPWINYLGTEEFFSLVSNTGGGYSFYRDARLRRITRYRYNSVPRDNTGKYFYIHDGGEFWSPGWKPVRRDLDFYECRHGLGYTRLTGRRREVQCEVLYFVPPGADAEVQRVTVANRGAATRPVTIFSSVEWCLWNALDDQTNFQRNYSTGQVEVDGAAVYHVTEYRERRNHFAFYSCNAEVSGIDTDRDTFLGLYGDYAAPAAVARGESFGSVADGWAPMASHCIALNLAPGESRTFVFVLGYVENDQVDKWEAGPDGRANKEPARRLAERFATVEKVDCAFEELRARWTDLLSHFRVATHDPRIDRMVNIWNQYQCMVTFNMSRSASYFESGIGRGLGFRDSNQDLLGFVHQIPYRARERLIDLAATQLSTGGAYHQFQPLTKRGNNDIGGDFNDDPLWLILGVVAYVKETGDWSILDEPVPFDCDPASVVPMFEHLRRAFGHVADNLGPHGLPLIGRADWNDCLNLNCFSMNPDDSFQTCTNRDGRTAESVMIAGLFVVAGRELAALCREWPAREAPPVAAAGVALDTESRTADMERAILEHGWDGAWFLRAYDDSGRKVGSAECEEGKILIESQGWCAMAGVGLAGGKVEVALDSVKERLDTAHGIVLVNPAYGAYHVELGEISSYPPGYKENAGIFCHNNPWIAIGETVLGRGDRAFEYWRKIAPSFREEISEVHRMEPYVYSQMIAGRDARRHGEAKNSWLTGTASWNFVAITQHILGVRPTWNGLIIDPCIPPEWEGFEVVRRFRGDTYRIRVTNPDHVSKGVRCVRLDGRDVPGGTITVVGDGREHVVEAVMGQVR